MLPSCQAFKDIALEISLFKASLLISIIRNCVYDIPDLLQSPLFSWSLSGFENSNGKILWVEKMLERLEIIRDMGVREDSVKDKRGFRKITLITHILFFHHKKYSYNYNFTSLYYYDLGE